MLQWKSGWTKDCRSSYGKDPFWSTTVYQHRSRQVEVRERKIDLQVIKSYIYLYGEQCRSSGGSRIAGNGCMHKCFAVPWGSVPTSWGRKENWRRLLLIWTRTGYKEFCRRLESAGVLTHQHVHTMLVWGNRWEEFSAQFYVSKVWTTFSERKPFWMTDRLPNSCLSETWTISFSQRINHLCDLECDMCGLWDYGQNPASLKHQWRSAWSINMFVIGLCLVTLLITGLNN